MAGHGLHIIDADEVGHEVLENSDVIGEIGAIWTDVIEDGEVDRRALGRVVFADPLELRRLESITHPRIFVAIADRVAEVEGLVAVELPLPGNPFDPPWPRSVVDAPDEIRLERVMSRGLSRDEALDRMARQPSRAEWLQLADVVVPNDGTMEDLAASIGRLADSLGWA